MSLRPEVTEALRLMEANTAEYRGLEENRLSFQLAFAIPESLPDRGCASRRISNKTVVITTRSFFGEHLTGFGQKTLNSGHFLPKMRRYYILKQSNYFKIELKCSGIDSVTGRPR